MSDKRLNRYDQRQGCTDIVEMDDGDYCLYDDVVELVDEIDRLRNIIKNRRCGDCMMEGE